MRSLIIIFLLLMVSPCWGADVLTNFGGFESRSTLGMEGTTGSPTFSTSVKKSGGASLEMAGSATEARVSYFNTHGSQGGGTGSGSLYTLFGFHFYATDVTPGSVQNMVRGVSTSSQQIGVCLEADGDLVVAALGDCTTVMDTVTTPFSINTWYYIEVAYFDSDSGTGEWWIDGVSQGTFSGDTNSGGNPDRLFFYGPDSGDGTWYFDNWYIVENDSSTIPTPLAASSDGLEVFPYQGGNTGSTADTGRTTNNSTLEAGTWNLCGETPWATGSSNRCSYTSSTKDGGVNFDDANAGGHGKGPTGGAYTLNGTIKGGKWSWYMARGTGGGTTHTLYYGSNNDSPLSSFTSSLDTGGSLRVKVLDGSDALVPTSSESFSMGFGVSGAQDIHAEEMMGEILHLPAAVGTTGSATIWLSWVPQEEREWVELERILGVK